jgi:hypothetical protein
MSKRKRLMMIAPAAIVFGTAAVAALGFIVSGLWNALMPAIFGLPEIGFWQALGLFLLARLLFGRFGGRGTKMRFSRGWQGLSPEQRQRFREAMGARCPERFREEPGEDQGQP